MPALVVDLGTRTLCIFVDPTDPHELVVMIMWDDESQPDDVIHIPIQGLKHYLEVLNATR